MKTHLDETRLRGVRYLFRRLDLPINFQAWFTSFNPNRQNVGLNYRATSTRIQTTKRFLYTSDDISWFEFGSLST